MTTVLFAIAVLGTLCGLFVWARGRAEVIRRQAAEREQAAMALMLAGGSAAEPEAAAEPEPPKRKSVGRVLDDKPVDRQAIEAAYAQAGENPKTLPPIEYPHVNGERTPTPAERAAADLDPIEDLISQIMVDEPPLPRKSMVAQAPVPAAPAAAVDADQRAKSLANVPLRELALAWYEARGYRGSPASPAVWPIELVLRHREDAARAYAFVVQSDLVSVDRITALIEQAREIGMMRVAVIADAGYERGAKEIARKRNVRLIDRRTMEVELSELQLPTAAKIIAVARTRASAEPSPV